MSRPNPMGRGGASDLSMRVKVAAVLAGVLLAIGLIGTAIISRVASQALRAEVHTQVGNEATATLASAAATLERQLLVLRAVGVDRVVRQGCARANAERAELEGDVLREAAREWAGASDSSELVRSVVDPQANPVTAQLVAHTTGLPIPGEMLVTDDRGVLVAATPRPEAYAQTATAWWHATYAGGLGDTFAGVIFPDESPTGRHVLEISSPVYDSSAQSRRVVGVVNLKMDLQALIPSSELRAARQTLIATAAGQVLAATDPGMVGTMLGRSWLDDSNPAARNQSVHEAEVAGGVPILVGRALMRGLSFEPDEESDALKDLDLGVYVYEPLDSAYAGVTGVSRRIWALGLAMLTAIGAGAYLLSRAAYVPVERLADFARKIGTGGEVERARVYPQVEAGALARALNVLLDEVETLQAAGAARDVHEEQKRERRQYYASLTTDLGDAVSAAANLEDIALRSVQLIREHLGLYFVGLYMVDRAGLWAVLHGGSGEEGQALLARGHRVAVGAGTVGRCVAGGRARVENDLGEVLDRVDGEVLPYGQSEAAVPLRSRGVVLGAISAQSYQSDAFDDEFLMVFQTAADRVAAAIDTVRLSTEGRAATLRLQRAHGEIDRAVWRDILGGDVGRGYEARLTGVRQLAAATPDEWETDLQHVWETNQSLGRHLVGDGGVLTHHLALPVRSRDAPIGVLDVSKLSTSGDWTSVEIQQLEGLADQLGQALENARLYEAAQQSALQEQSVGDVTRRIRETLSVDTVLKTALEELRSLMDLQVVEIRVGQASEALGAGHGSDDGTG